MTPEQVTGLADVDVAEKAQEPAHARVSAQSPTVDAEELLRVHDEANALLKDAAATEYKDGWTYAEVERTTLYEPVGDEPGGPVVGSVLVTLEPHKPRKYLGRPPEVPEDVVLDIMVSKGEGMTFYGIAAKLNEEGVPTAHAAKAWTPNAVERVYLSDHAKRLRRNAAEGLV